VRDPKLETKRYWLLRWWRPRDDKTLFAKDVSHYNDVRRSWATTEEIKEAYKFPNRSDARQVAKRVKAFKELREGKDRLIYVAGRATYRNDPTSVYFWELIEVTETITTVYEEEITASNAPPMVRLARSID
jgi:hypothetical protein